MLTVSRKDFKMQQITDENPDLSFLETKYDAKTKTITDSCAYSNKDIADLGWKTVKGYIDQDARRLATYGETWYMTGIRAQVTLMIPNGKGFIMQSIESPGLWGIESDSDKEYIKETFEGECETLKDMLAQIGVTVTD